MILTPTRVFCASIPHISCHPPLMAVAVISNMVAFVIAMGKQRASQCDLAEWKIFLLVEKHTWGAKAAQKHDVERWQYLKVAEHL